MDNNELVIGKTAIFKHCDMGLIDVEITQESPLKPYYNGILKEIHHKEVMVNKSVAVAVDLLSKGKEVVVFLKPSDLVRYK